MRKLEGDRQDWADSTVGELALRAGVDAAADTVIAEKLRHALLTETDKASLDVYSFVRSINFMMRLGKRNQVIVSMKPQDLIDILCGDRLPSMEELSSIVRVAHFRDEVCHDLQDALMSMQRETPSPNNPPASLAETLEQQSEIIAFGAVMRERLRRMAGASASSERTVA